MASASAPLIAKGESHSTNTYESDYADGAPAPVYCEFISCFDASSITVESPVVALIAAAFLFVAQPRHNQGDDPLLDPNSHHVRPHCLCHFTGVKS